MPSVTYAQMELRKEVPLIYEFFTCTERAETFQKLGIRRFAVDKLIPSNLVLFPEDTKFDTYMNEIGSNVSFRASVEGRIDRWVSIVRGIYKHGH
jgi:hypothetical protein